VKKYFSPIKTVILTMIDKDKVLEASTLSEALGHCLDRRDRGFWSFRGQRNASWNLGLHGIDGDLDKHLEQFRRRCMEFPPPHYLEEDDALRWLFFAQHHRLKTRLLDWTKNPLIAIYFAVENILSHTEDGEKDGAIWVLHVGSDHFLNAQKYEELKLRHDWVIVNPPPITSRLLRQSGLFTFHPEGKDSVPIDLMKRRSDQEELIKIVIPKVSTNYIRQQLGILNIHHASLFPDYDGIAEFINHEWPIITQEEHLHTPTTSTM
jgi:hypothetical protein